MKKYLFKQISIIGLGLIGSSLALSIKKNKLAGKTLGYAKSSNTRKKAKKLKLVDVVSNPEFLREGEAIRDFKYPDRIVIGSNNKKIFKKMELLYEPLIKKGAKFFCSSRKGAELIKYASNAFLATKITFINEIANLCEKTGINVEDISIGMGLDKRIGSRFLRAGPAYGGSCFPKDTKAITSTADKFKINLSVIKTVIKSNENRSKLLLKRVFEIL